jgi:hypothetical protein
MTHLALGCSPESDPSLAAMEECCRTGAEYCAQAHKHTSTQAHKHTSTQAHKHTSTQAHKHTSTKEPVPKSEGFGVAQRNQSALENTTLTQCPVRVSYATLVGFCSAYLPRPQRLRLRSGGWQIRTRSIGNPHMHHVRDVEYGVEYMQWSRAPNKHSWRRIQQQLTQTRLGDHDVVEMGNLRACG